MANKYKMQVVDEAKNIVTIKPTAGTWVKAFMPALIIWGVLAVMSYWPTKTPAEDIHPDLIDFENTNK